MRKKCRHDVKIKIMLSLFKPMVIRSLKQKVRLSPRKMNNILDGLIERRLVREIRNKDGTVLFHTTPEGRKIVKLYKDLTDQLEGKEVLPHVFGVYR